MKSLSYKALATLLVLCCTTPLLADESILPPIKNWSGNSLALIKRANDPWQTPAEAMALNDTPSYQQTVDYLIRLVGAETRFSLQSIGKTAQQRDIWMLIASAKGAKTVQKLKANGKPTVLIQAGIHAGEIDGKDAGLMLLRDISKYGKDDLLQGVNILFIPMLNADGHERRSAYNRVNQRGPKSMGWRTNAQNLNLNRDYAKADTPEIRALIQMINQWQPDLYLDLHVTDGEDYQYDITYGFNGAHADSPQISAWLKQVFSPYINQALASQGHIGGPLVFAREPSDFSQGLFGWTAGPRFSNGWGDVRQLPTVLVENHSLKPYKQRVLGTYVFLEATLKLLVEQGESLIKITQQEQRNRPKQMTLEWQLDLNNPEANDFLGIDYRKQQDPVTGLDYVVWNGKAKTYPNFLTYWQRQPVTTVKVPKAFYIPVQYQAIIERLNIQGIKLQTLKRDERLELTQFVAKEPVFNKLPFEGHMTVKAGFNSVKTNQLVPAGTIKVTTEQALGRLAVALLDPRGPDSFFAWGFFNQMFQRTEYIEPYVMVPLAKKMLAANPALQAEFKAAFKPVARSEGKNNNITQLDDLFAQRPDEVMSWFYQRSPYYDQQYLKYPVLMSY